MKKNIRYQNPISLSLALSVLFFSFLLFSGFDCGTGIKERGQQGKIGPDPSLSSGSTDTFTLSFAVRDTSTDSDLDLQGGSNSAGALAGICGTSGSNCVCDFFTDSSGNGKVSSTSGASTYSQTGNYLSCDIPAGSTPATFTYARIRNIQDTRQSNTVIITNQDDADTTKRLTLLKILGDLSVNQVRKTYEYRCYFNYLRKAGTTTTTFDCTAGAFSIAQVPYHYYLYADNKTNNIGSRVPDLLHNDGSGTLCNSLVKFIDCTTSVDGLADPNELTLKFGLYSESKGLFTVPVTLTSAPTRLNGSSSVYGYAAPYDTTTSTCPPGFEAKQFFKQTPAAVANSNLNSTLVDTRAYDLGGSFNMLVDEFTAGGAASCNGTTCTPPSLDRDSVAPDANLQTTAYTAQTGTTDRFCVLPSSLLSGI